MAPDWLTKATSPCLGMRWANDALIRGRVEMKPMQLGPTIRSRWGLAASSIFWRSSLPSTLSPSPKPAVMTTAARQPFSPSSAMTPGMASGGVAMTARSTGMGRSAMLA